MSRFDVRLPVTYAKIYIQYGHIYTLLTLCFDKLSFQVASNAGDMDYCNR